MAKEHYHANLIVIGAGSGGLVCAAIGAAIQAKVILIEKDEMGGDCLNTGCVPSKALIASAKFLAQMKNAKHYGIKQVEVTFSFADIMQRVQRIIESIRPHDSVERFTQLGIEVIRAQATLTSPHSVQVNGKTLTARSIIIATGAKPFVPPIPGLREIKYLTSDNLWSLRQLPPRLLVLGGGPIGCELAQCFARFGSQVTIVEQLPQIMIREDPQIFTLIAAKLKADGVAIRTDHKAIRIQQKNGQQILRCQHQSQQVDFEFDQILVAVGRAANIHGFGLDQLNIPLSAHHSVETDDYLQAGYPSLYACGDVVGPYQFTHTASHQAWTATINALFRPFKKFKIDYSVLPWTTYTDPEIARVGLNEQQARQQGIPYELTELSMADLDRAIIEGQTAGIIRILTKPGKDKILGATIASKHAGEIITELVLAMRHGLGLNKIMQTIHAYPGWSECNKHIAATRRRNHAPAWALKGLHYFHNIRRKKLF